MGLRRQLFGLRPHRHDQPPADQRRRNGDGAPANLAQVDFIMVQTGVNAKAPLIGEVSTEVSGIGCYRTVTKKQ